MVFFQHVEDIISLSSGVYCCFKEDVVILIVVSLYLSCLFFLDSFKVFTLSLLFYSFTTKSIGLSESDDWYLS